MPPLQAGSGLATKFSTIGEVKTLRTNEAFLIGDSEYFWFIASGQIELFVVQTMEDEPVGPRTHFATFNPGSVMLGMDFSLYGQSSGFLATSSDSTQIYKISRDKLRVLARDREYTLAVGELINGWLQTLSSSVARDVRPRPKPDETLTGGKETKLLRGNVARARKGVVWIQVMKGEALYLGMEAVSVTGDGASILPISTDTWIEAYDECVLHSFSTPLIITQATFWRGIDLFHEVLCQCEFINKKLRMVDEFNRIRLRESFGQRSKDIALREIASVLDESGRKNGAGALDDDLGDQTFSVCKLIGEASGIRVVAPPDLRRLKQRLPAIAKASRFRFRSVALRDNWWETDHGPLLAYREQGLAPVAILKDKATNYELVDTETNQRVPIDAAVASTLCPFAVSLYTPFPEHKLGAWDLLKFGIRESKLDMWTILGMGILLGLLGMVTPYFSGQIFDSIIPAADRVQLFQFAVGLLAAAFGTFAFELVRAISVLRMAGKMDYLVQAGVWDRLLSLPSNFFRDYAAGDLADRALGVDQIRQAVSQAGTQAIVGSISAVIMIVFLFSYNTQMAFVAIGLVLLSVIFPTVLNLLQVKHQRKLFYIRGSISGLVLQLINGVNKLRVSGAEDRAFREWARKFSDQKRIAFKAGKLANAAHVFNQIFPVLCSAIIFGTYAWFRDLAAKNGDTFKMSTGEFIAFNTTFTLILSSFLSLAAASLELMIIVPLFERLVPIIEAPPEIDEAKAHPGELTGEIEVSHLTFRYSADGPPILRDVSLHIRPGEFVALVGGSGSGKSTLLRLLLGFEKPESGAILYDNQDLYSLDLREVRQQTGVVLQSSKLMPTDIYRNIIGSHQLSLNDAWEAARMSGLDRDIKNMPMGMNTVVSEGGGTFSGGQRQRLMVARALVNKPRIIFFDEATSALDNETQRTVTDSLDAMQSTRIVIAHRLSTIINADRIFVLMNGEMVQSGSYAELMNQPGPFAELAKRQLA
jgi:NHLM bacteriocin system ABC transporter ATP-binding protein